jgi:hypothetical protein
MHFSCISQVIYKYLDEEGNVKLPTSPQPSPTGEGEQTGGGGNTPTPSPSTGDDDNGGEEGPSL